MTLGGRQWLRHQGTASSGQTYANVVAFSGPPPSFKIPMRFAVEIYGEQGFIFSDAEMNRAAEDLRFDLMLKFLKFRPSIDKIRIEVVKTWGFSKIPMISIMDDYHVLVQLRNERVLVHGLAREGRIIAGCSFCAFRWHKDFDMAKETMFAPE